jgi:hypothetical protein
LDDVELMNVALNGFPKSWEQTWEESKRNKHGSSDEKLALVSKKRKGKGKGSNNKGNNDGGTSQLGKKKDLSKIKCFSCHKNGHYASQCLEKNKGRGKVHAPTSTKTQLDEFDSEV